jgi:hypothetical protein
MKSEYEEEFEMADGYAIETYIDPHTNVESPFITRGTLRHELERLPEPTASKELISFIEY